MAVHTKYIYKCMNNKTKDENDIKNCITKLIFLEFSHILKNCIKLKNEDFFESPADLEEN